VGRTLGIPLTLVTLLAGAFLFVQQSKTVGPASTTAAQAETQAVQEGGAANFLQVQQVLQAYYAENGTYVGATLPPGSGVTLAAATGSSYCLETSVQGAVSHETGPGGQPAPGPC
jgi:hypothetical protein